MHNTFRAILAMTTFLVTGALSSCNHTDELEPESPAPQIVFLFSPGGLGDMSYNDRILEGVQRFKMENGDIDIYIYSPESLQEAEKIFADWLERPQSSIPVLFVLGSSDYEQMAELYLAEHPTKVFCFLKAGNSIRTRTSIPSRFRCSGLHTLQEYVQENVLR